MDAVLDSWLLFCVLFRLVSTELLEGDFYTCANTKRDTELAKRALLEEKSIWAVDTHTCQQKLSLPHKKRQEKQTHWNHTKQEGTGQGQQVAEVKESKGLKLSCQLTKAQA